jgi:nucleoside 2-deoxyribosyltransferase
MYFPDGTFNVFIIGPMGMVEKELHQRSPMEKLLNPGFSPQEHTEAIRKGLERVLESADGRQALTGQRPRIDIPNDQQGTNIMNDVFNKIDNADLVIADLYLNRPTVYYEIALAHSLGVPVIIVTKKGEKVAFYFQEMRTHYVEAYTAENVAAVLRDPILAFLAGEDRQGFHASPFENFFRAPVVDISAAAGLAGGYYVNMVRDVIFQSGGALAQGGLEHFYVIRLDDILTREEDEKRLRSILARATGEEHDNAAGYNQKFTRPTSGNRPIWAAVAGNAIIDLPTPLYSLFQAPRYQRLQARLGHDHTEARRMRQRMIDAFFAALRRQMDRDDAISRDRLQVVSFDELEARLGLA